MKTKIPCFDAHCDTLVYGDRLHQVRLDQERFSARGQLFAVCAEGEMQRDLTYFTRYARRLTAMPNVVLCRDGDEIGRACRRGQTAAVLSIEGAECVGCEIGLLRQAHALGARAVGLTHNRFNGLTGTCAEETDMGLTERGRAFAEAAVELDMILDISHMSDAGAAELFEIGRRRVMASHSNARAVCRHPRNLTDELFLKLVAARGICGINLYAPFVREDGQAAIDDVVRHIEHFAGLDPHAELCLALGCDFDGCDRLPDGLSSSPELTRLAEALLRYNYPQDMVENIFYYNLYRFLRHAL